MIRLNVKNAGVKDNNIHLILLNMFLHKMSTNPAQTKISTYSCMILEEKLFEDCPRDLTSVWCRDGSQMEELSV